MIKDVAQIETRLKAILKDHLGPLRVRVDSEKNFEVCGTIKAMQGKKEVDGYYFASVMPKPKDVRFYFFAAYTHASAFQDLSPELAKLKKGKSCFHIKYLTEELEQELSAIVAKAIGLYQADGVLAAH